ncbi:MAG: methyltransferase domain-containing protein [Bacteroidetes bacterium]|nr:methyltransferase domain-containing protein [Bacteroidota bacterium]
MVIDRFEIDLSLSFPCESIFQPCENLPTLAQPTGLPYLRRQRMQEHLTPTPFDATARGYDLEFTETQIGRMQRAVTHRYLQELIQTAKPQTALELNCGTGEDALWLANQGLLVTATDLSAEMVEATTQKVIGKGIRVLQTGIQGLDQTLPYERYDLIWSNFGGFNCLTAAEIQASAATIRRLLKPGGHFVAVVMGKFCAWETLYFLAKLQPAKAFRRFKRGPVKARLADGVFQDTYYYRPTKFERLLSASLIPERRLAVGAYLPPSYLDPFFAKRPNLLAKMNRWETNAYSKRFPAKYSDHFLVAFRRR